MQSEQINELATALVKAQAEFGAVPKGSVNPFFKSKYASLEDIVEACRPALSKHGLSITQMPENDAQGNPTLSTLLGHSSGQFIEGNLKLILGKIDVQSLGSALSYIRRYSYAATAGVVVGDEDDDGNAAMPVRSQPAVQPQAVYKKTLSAVIEQDPFGDRK